MLRIPLVTGRDFASRQRDTGTLIPFSRDVRAFYRAIANTNFDYSY
jgi:hypothetical protein